jgi:hypothetical protein
MQVIFVPLLVLKQWEPPSLPLLEYKQWHETNLRELIR